jgi:4-hydroxybenzoate polyprenyltransferase
MRAEEQTTRPQAPSGGLGAVVEAMRIPHWIKNAFVAAPILFAGRLGDAHAWGRCLAAVAAFCLLSSAVYLVNDVVDRAADAQHPTKRRRPVASGRLSPASAVASAVVLFLAAGALVAWVSAADFRLDGTLLGLGLLTWAGAYLVLNLLYSFWLKSHMIVDVIAVAVGFVFRAMAGAAAIDVPASPWLVVCTFTLCLFIALAKRRGEIIELPWEQAGRTRAVNAAYTRVDLEHMLTVSAALAIVTYILYCLAPRTIHHFHSANMVWTIPIVVYGMFRYYRLTMGAGLGEPVGLLLRDRILWLVVAIYVLAVAAIVAYGGHPAVRGLIDFSAVDGG